LSSVPAVRGLPLLVFSFFVGLLAVVVEVSTKPAARSRGYAKTLLQLAVEFMQSRSIWLSALHTSNVRMCF
jgi:ribosomal protein S18 acetylase RimI-like enzyme